MHVEQMNEAAGRDFDLGLEHASRFAAAAGEIVVARGEHGETREREIAVGASAIDSIGSEGAAESW